MSKRIEDRPGPSRTSVYAILDALREKREGDNRAEDMRRAWVGKAIVAHPADGASTVYATVWDNTPEAEKADSVAGRLTYLKPPRKGRDRYGAHDGSASGYGYDKTGAALANAVYSAGGFGRLTAADSPESWKMLTNAAQGAGESVWRTAFESAGYVVLALL